MRISRSKLIQDLEPFAQGCFSGEISEWPQLKPLLRNIYDYLVRQQNKAIENQYLIQAIISETAEIYHMDPKLLTGKSRAHNICHVRHEAMRACRSAGFRVCHIARAFNRSHATVILYTKGLKENPTD